jgi:hypothetical protein
MKRIAALFAALVFAFAIAACDGDDDATEAPADDAAVEQPADEETADEPVEEEAAAEESE